MALLKLALLLSIPQLVTAHYNWAVISVNGGALSKPWDYVRMLTKNEADDPSYFHRVNPLMNVYKNDIRCGWAADKNGQGVKTLQVNAGDALTFYPVRPNEQDKDEVYYPMYHPGVGQAYLSKPTGDLESYTGDGDWFKIGSITSTSDGKNWVLDSTAASMNFTLPKTTPPGKYLMRVEELYYQDPYFKYVQMFIACAHVEVKGPGGGTPGPMVQFPGAYDSWDRSMFSTHAMGRGGVSPGENYIAPGPALWKG